MKLSTRLTHARLNLKHKILRLRVQKPLYYRSLIVLIIAVGIGGIIAIYLTYTKKPSAVNSTETPVVSIKEYSMNGKVISRTANELTIISTTVRVTGGTSTVEEIQKIVTINPNTPVLITSINNTDVNSKPGSETDITSGTIITVYATSNPTLQERITPTRVEILN